jgi:hypothetical protein
MEREKIKKTQNEFFIVFIFLDVFKKLEIIVQINVCDMFISGISGISRKEKNDRNR